MTSFMTNALATNDTFNETSGCTQKQSSDAIYNMTYFISNITCIDASSCLGTKDYPFDSMIKALTLIHNIDLSQRFQCQYIKLYVLGSPHYIFNKDQWN